MPFTELPIGKAFTLLEPGPVTLVTTSEHGRNNIMTITWHMVMDFTPKIAMETGPWNYSFGALMRTKECAVCIPAVDLAEKTVSIGCCSGSDTDKFKEFALTPLPAHSIGAPLIGECVACIECRVSDYIEEHGIFVLTGIRAYTNCERKEQRTFHAKGDGTFSVDGAALDMRSLMAGKLPPGV